MCTATHSHAHSTHHWHPCISSTFLSHTEVSGEQHSAPPRPRSISRACLPAGLAPPRAATAGAKRPRWRTRAAQNSAAQRILKTDPVWAPGARREGVRSCATAAAAIWYLLVTSVWDVNDQLWLQKRIGEQARACRSGWGGRRGRLQKEGSSASPGPGPRRGQQRLLPPTQQLHAGEGRARSHRGQSFLPSYLRRGKRSRAGAGGGEQAGSGRGAASFLGRALQ